MTEPSPFCLGEEAEFFAVSQLSLSFGGVHAVNDVSFSVASGEVYAIIGPNGAGKTSIFNLITRVFGASKGSVKIKGREIIQVPRHKVVEYGIARTFQNIELFERATVLDNLLMGRNRFSHGSIIGQVLNTRATLQGENESRARVEDIIGFLDLECYRDRMVFSLAYGVRKIIELGRALAAAPCLLLLDEPASGLNAEETRRLAFWIDDIRHVLGITVIMIEHDMSLVSDIADRVLVLNHGEVLTGGTPDEVKSDPRVIKAYLGE